MTSERREITYADAGVEALREEMRRDSTIVYIGQGIGPRGGNFLQTKGLWAEFGESRLRDTGITELAQTGAAIGAAMAGSRAIADNVFLDFSLEAMSQIIQQAANAHYLSNGQLKVPVMIRGSMGSVRNAGVQHSHTYYAWFAHTPGLKVAVPSTPYDVKGLMKTALRDDCPVVFIEHKALYNMKGNVPDQEYLIPLGKASVCREGTTATVVAVGRMVHVSLDAARILDKEGISLEIIDPRTIAPLDRAAIAASIRKTTRVAVVEEANLSCGFSGEVFTVACEECFDSLDAPPKRICALPVPNPFSPVLEKQMLPSLERVVSEIRDWVNS
ncbi:MAG: pyruvate dehydrogenase complex E1 component subunit beta [Bryobacteraceae bacterium]